MVEPQLDSPDAAGPSSWGVRPRPKVAKYSLPPASAWVAVHRRFAQGFDRDPRRCRRWSRRRVRRYPQLVAAACQVGGLGLVARELDGLVVRGARLLTSAQPAQ